MKFKNGLEFSEKVENSVENLEKILNYKFANNKDVLVAIQHPGFKKADKLFTRHFERLEFLGDRVLGLSIASLMYKRSPNEKEGDLAVRMSVLAGTEFLIDLAKKTKMIHCFSIPKDLFISKNKNSAAIADMVEAVFASIFLDGGFEKAKAVIYRLWEKEVDKVIYKEKDSKTRLQEFVQSKTKQLPVYRLLKMSGKAHDPIFEMEVSACDQKAEGYGNSKKSAESDAAEKLLQKLENGNHPK